MASNGLKLRDSIATMITGLIDRQRPKPRVCEVYSYNRFTRFAEVLLPGETEPGIQARFPAHLQPTASKMDDGVGTAVGDLVLVEGTANNYRITQVVQGNAFSFESSLRAYNALAGGGVITWDDRYLKWTYNLTTFVGVDNVITNAVFQISMPVLDEVITCHGITGYTQTVVTASGIDMRPDGAMMSTALYWEPDITVTNTGDTGVFHLVGGLIPTFIPPHWIMIAVMNQTNDYLYIGTGHTLKYGQSVQYGELQEIFIGGYQATASSIPTSAQFALISNWTQVDTNPTWFSYSAGVWTFNAPGRYEANVQVGFAASAVGGRSALIRQNGSTTAVQSNSAPAPGTIGSAVILKKDLFIAAGDTIQIEAYQVSGGSLNTAPGASYCFYQFRRKGSL